MLPKIALRSLSALLTLVGLFAGSAAFAQGGEACMAFPADQDSYACTCPPGPQSGQVWGSGPYTANSSICAAAQHAGVIEYGGGLVVAVRGEGQSKYRGTESNGIRSNSFSASPVSFTFDTGSNTVAACGAFPDDQESYTCSCRPGGGSGAVWGTSPYTMDSDICTAALHGGLITTDGGVVTVLRTEGLPDYRGTLNVDIQSRDWGSYTESYVFDYNY